VPRAQVRACSRSPHHPPCHMRCCGRPSGSGLGAMMFVLSLGSLVAVRVELTREVRLHLSLCDRRIPFFAQDMLGEGFNGSSGRCAKNVSLRSKLARRRSDAQRATRIGELRGAAPDGISSAGLRVGRSRGATGKSQTRNAPMKANAVRFAAAFALVDVGAALPACGQYFPPALIIVPPPAQNYATPKPAPKPPPDKPKPTADTPPAAKPKGHYQGQTFVPD
jgi:hypothetical protein